MTTRILLALSILAACGADAPPASPTTTKPAPVVVAPAPVAVTSLAGLDDILKEHLLTAKATDKLPIMIWYSGGGAQPPLDPTKSGSKLENVQNLVVGEAVRADLAKLGVVVQPPSEGLPVLQAEATPAQIAQIRQHPNVAQIFYYDAAGYDDSAG